MTKKDKDPFGLPTTPNGQVIPITPSIPFNALDVVLIEKLISAFAADLERGTYPMFLANETTFSLSVAESKKDSFTTMLELNAVI